MLLRPVCGEAGCHGGEQVEEQSLSPHGGQEVEREREKIHCQSHFTIDPCLPMGPTP
jgi:hypothetical protein